MTTIRQVLREKYVKEAETIYRIKERNRNNLAKFPKSEDWGPYCVAKRDASLLLTVIRIVKLFPDEIKELVQPFVFNEKDPNLKMYSRTLTLMLQQGGLEIKRHKIRNKILSAIPLIKPHCHKKQARKMIKRALKYIRRISNELTLEKAFQENPEVFLYKTPPEILSSPQK